LGIQSSRARGNTQQDCGNRERIPVGKSDSDWVKTFQAAKTGGVKSDFVEQNMDFTNEASRI
jgi:hypothetical protein